MVESIFEHFKIARNWLFDIFSAEVVKKKKKKNRKNLRTLYSKNTKNSVIPVQ